MKKSASLKRDKLRMDFWPNEDAWTGEGEKGWFRAPRTIPLILVLLRDKGLSEKMDPSTVYLELLARHIDGGIVEMGDEEQHAYASGFTGSRAVRSWRERMDILKKVGFIKTKEVGNRQYGVVLLVHPTVAVKRLHDDGLVSEPWWNAYLTRKSETKEAAFEERQKELRLHEVAEGGHGEKNEITVAE